LIFYYARAVWTSSSPKFIHHYHRKECTIKFRSGRIKETIFVPRFDSKHKSIQNTFSVKIVNSVHRVLFNQIELI
ncbi:MAG: hypothetical protein ACKO96_04480, partial [Flammeovirgaceae bacterium]